MAMEKAMNWETVEVEYDDIPNVSNVEAAKAVIGAIIGEAETIIGSGLEWTGSYYMAVGAGMVVLGDIVKDHGIRFRRKHYTTLETWSKNH